MGSTRPRSRKRSKRVGDWIAFLDHKAPESTAEAWDPVGLLVGDHDQVIHGARVSIDLDEQVLEQALRGKANLIVNHHPCLFPKSRKMSPVTRRGMPLVFQAIQQGVSIVACHTNFDRCALEVGEIVARGLGIDPIGRLTEFGGEDFQKLVVFAPKSHAEQVESALFSNGAGHIGRYDACAFSVNGQGSFRPLEGSKPFIGTKGRIERVDEVRIEVTVPKSFAPRAVQAMLSVHPYEEVAYDLSTLAHQPAAQGIVRGIGYGVWGEFAQKIPFSDLVSSVKKLFRLGGYSSPGFSSGQAVRRVGYVPGKGSAFIECAHQRGLDVLITGEVGYHSHREARDRGLVILEIGHAQSECFFPAVMKKWLREFLDK